MIAHQSLEGQKWKIISDANIANNKNFWERSEFNPNELGPAPAVFMAITSGMNPTVITLRVNSRGTSD
jgi:hypothetical protein